MPERFQVSITHKINYLKIALLVTVSCWAITYPAQQVLSQPITGTWKGKVGNVKTEVKLIKKGDSLVGTSYYYSSKNSYRRYAVKGYFDDKTNSVVWWDDALLEDKHSSRLFSKAKEALLSIADFNCPGEDHLLLDGSSSDRDERDQPEGEVHLQKSDKTSFPDEWDFVIENYTVGANAPYIIDSISRMSFAPVPQEEVPESYVPPATVLAPVPVTPPPPVVIPPVTAPDHTLPPDVIHQKFTQRTRKLQTVIPITGKTIELIFYDNAVVDGDSIALFLNNRMIFKNIRLTDKPYTITLQADELQDDNELVMVAENLGSIPPNTSLMVAIAGGKRYEARLYADENNSALIRLVKKE